ncbi:large conductance mechanosensitive channel protein MscL [Kordia sp. YSTF-M3]|uniref:Large-conductance mechanosensitive channel n=1 Tax=Kordia aestuariivivens TaxID=2759037 RepID=A0ABR7QEJ6_9FLAO|nr:large conductance mechanosensitive channel protein MscL [Kordia aestuariivivens]MBC8756985.1 large conductance mechanosensitive channel protein MscL [Kordia aestuariivivens]
MLKEFKEFITGGNVIEFAVAVIMAGAIGGVVKGFVDNIVMPFVGYFTGGTDFANMFLALDGKEYETLAAAKEAGGAVISYGIWINAIVNLLIVGLVMFLIVKAYNKMKKKEEAAAPAPPAGPTQEELLGEIRDLLKK